MQTYRRLPKHIGVIPDGNRRWALGNGMEKHKKARVRGLFCVKNVDVSGSKTGQSIRGILICSRRIISFCVSTTRSAMKSTKGLSSLCAFSKSRI